MWRHGYIVNQSEQSINFAREHQASPSITSTQEGGIIGQGGARGGLQLARPDLIVAKKASNFVVIFAMSDESERQTVRDDEVLGSSSGGISRKLFYGSETENISVSEGHVLDPESDTPLEEKVYIDISESQVPLDSSLLAQESLEDFRSDSDEKSDNGVFLRPTRSPSVHDASPSDRMGIEETDSGEEEGVIEVPLEEIGEIANLPDLSLVSQNVGEQSGGPVGEQSDEGGVMAASERGGEAGARGTEQGGVMAASERGGEAGAIGTEQGRRLNKRGRVRERNVDQWVQNVAKKRRNLGLAYTSYTTKKEVAERVMGEECPDKCFTKLGLENPKKIFDDFWAIGDYSQQNAYLMSLINKTEVKRKRKPADEPSRREFHYQFHINVNQRQLPICRSGFTAIFGLGQKKVKNLVAKIKSGVSPHGTPVMDQRGKHTSARAITAERKATVHEHIKLLPIMASHYSRAHSPHRYYLESSGDSTVGHLYQLYIMWMGDEYPDIEIVTLRTYHDIFTTNYNIVFTMPKTDLCNTCELLKAQINDESDERKRDELNAKIETHKSEAQVPRDLMRQAEREAPNIKEGLKIVAMDLQQQQPVPKMQTGIAFYKRKLWLYNFCIYDLNDNKGNMYVWHEGTAGRGADEIASCLSKFIDGLMTTNYTHLRVYCDNCAGQNKNIMVVLMALQKVHQDRLQRIEIVFMKTGHSYLSCDRAFGHIEKKLRKLPQISTPQNYRDLIARCVQNGYNVFDMTRLDFHNYKELKTHIKAPTGISQACQLVLDSSYPEGFMIKTDYDVGDEPRPTLNKQKLMKGKGKWSKDRFDLSKHPAPVKYPDARLIDQRKCNDLRVLMSMLSGQAKKWFVDFLDNQDKIRGTEAPEQMFPEEEPDPDDDMLDYASLP